MLASGNTDGSVVLYDILKNAYLEVFPAHFDAVGACNFNK